MNPMLTTTKTTMLSFEKVENMIHFSSSTPLFQQHDDLQNHFLLPPPPPPPPLPNLTARKTRKGRGRSRDPDLNNIDNLENTDPKKWKLIHRNTERQRRQEMATLHHSLHSKIPVDWIKGIRSVADRTNVAADYIKHMQKKVEDLNQKRDELKRLLDSSSSSSSDKSEHGSSHVKVEACGAGGVIEVTISSPSGGSAMPLSRVLNLLKEEGLNTFSCISTKSPNQQTFIHTIQSEVRGTENMVDAVGLQLKLRNLSSQ